MNAEPTCISGKQLTNLYNEMGTAGKRITSIIRHSTVDR